MKQNLFAILIISALLLPAAGATPAQTPTPQKTPPVIVAQPNTEQKTRITEAAKTLEKKMQEVDTARDKYMIVLLGILAELGLKPSETTLSWNDKGEPVFSRATPAVAAKPEPAKTEVKP